MIHRSVTAPKFIEDPHFYVDEEGFHLRDGAPVEIVSEFEQYIKEQNDAEKRGVVL